MMTRRSSLPRAADPSLYLELERQRDAFDQLLASAVDGVRSAAHYDALQEQAFAIRDALEHAFKSARRA